VNLLVIIKSKIFGLNSLGMYLAANNSWVLYPLGIEQNLLSKLQDNFEILIPVNINHSSLIGAYVTMNNNGILLPRIIYDEEFTRIKKEVGDAFQMKIVNSLDNALGNMILCNDKGAIISSLLKNYKNIIRDILDVEVNVFEFGGNKLPGSNGIVNNKGCCIHPLSTDEDVEIVSNYLHVPVDLSTINRGIPYVGSGAIVNDTTGIFGLNSTGPEMMRLTNVLGL
jgi:translation initiation factor 6